MSYASNLSPSPPTQLGDQSQGSLASIGGDLATDNTAHPHSAATPVQYHNHNQGRGMFNHIHGNQEINVNISMDIAKVLSELPQSRILLGREQVEGFLKIVGCAAKAKEIIRRNRNALRLDVMTFLSDVEDQARKYASQTPNPFKCFTKGNDTQPRNSSSTHEPRTQTRNPFAKLRVIFVVHGAPSAVC
ncbi:hypothetical protein PTI98_012920 [Pleurotus ostreatus]|nr:hypothetical protein PTI98_012920 [Pleurotus ostreatus]